jgi:ribonuclease R
MKAPFIYRVHEQPDAEKIERFKKVASLFGEKIRLSASLQSAEIHRTIKQIQDKPYGNTLMQLLLRSMAKARYSNQCLGHFGLASIFYCHFTSPIRRYPDLFIHRVVKAYILGQSFPGKWVRNSAAFSDANSDSERNAMQAERESVDFKTAEYMEKHVGDIFEGKVTGMMRAGVFIQLENTIEGMAPFRTMGAYYEFDEDQMVSRSDVGNRTIRIGDIVTVKVVQADRIARRIEFLLDEKTLKQEAPPFRNRKGRQNSKFTKKISNKKSHPKKKGSKRS